MLCEPLLHSLMGRLYWLILGTLRELVSRCLGLESREDLELREPQQEVTHD